ncbi:MAG: surfeit locus 1 family protein [Paracoccaceae bacterium]|jgi:surfeit locus 1 family protein
MTTDGSRFRPSFWMTAFAIPSLIVLIGLGLWQVQRLEWKHEIIADRMERMSAPAVAVSAVPDAGWRAFELRPMRARGVYRHDKSLEIASRTLKGRPGVHVLTPLVLADGSGTVLVNRGWAPPVNARNPAEFDHPGGMVTVDGFLRAGAKTSAWVPDNEPANDIWFYADAPAMAKARGLGVVKPYVIELAPTAAGIAGARGYPIAGQTVTAIRNNHLQYAVTWFGLAATLVVIYVLYQIRRRD